MELRVSARGRTDPKNPRLVGGQEEMRILLLEPDSLVRRDAACLLGDSFKSLIISSANWMEALETQTHSPGCQTPSVGVGVPMAALRETCHLLSILGLWATNLNRWFLFTLTEKIS